MAYYERDYFRGPPQRAQASSPKLQAGGRFLLIFTALTFLIVWFMEGAPKDFGADIANSEILKWLVVGPNAVFPGDSYPAFSPWQIFTAGLVESSIINVVMTCVVLIWLIGSRIEEAVGTRRFIIFWFSSMVIGTLVGALIDPLIISALSRGELSQPVYTFGTLAVSTSILSGAAMLFPDAKSLFDIKLKTLVYVILAIQLAMVAFVYLDPSKVQGTAIASLPAGIVGIFWGRLFVKAALAKGLGAKPKAKERHLRALPDEDEDYLSYAKQFSLDDVDEKEPLLEPVLSRTEEKRIQRETEERRKVDFLLSRISSEGMDSLSRSEKAFLERYSKRKRETSRQP